MSRRVTKHAEKDRRPRLNKLRNQIAAWLKKEDIEDVHVLKKFTNLVIEETNIEEIESPKHAKQMLDLGNMCRSQKLYDNAKEFGILATKYNNTRDEANALLLDLVNLQSSSDQCYSKSMDEEEAEKGPPSAKNLDKSLSAIVAEAANPNEAISGLGDHLIPPITEENTSALLAAIERARIAPPSDPDAFCAEVNRLLDAYGLRIQDGDKPRQFRLAAKTVGKYRYIQFQITGGSRGGFKNADLRLVQRQTPSQPHLSQ